ncbi:hypothetical protein I4U23_030177 [Adineta vaga]|nr:hypothetical protein I4U23_030177 [Adineta vaga]
MERSRDGYRGRYRDRHNNDLKTQNHYDNRSLHGNYRENPSHDNDYNSKFSSTNSPDNNYNYRSTRISLNSRPVSSRNGSSTHYRNDNYPISSHLLHSSIFNRTNNGQMDYCDKQSPSPPPSRYDRSSIHRNTHSSLLDEQPTLSNRPSSYYSSSSPHSPHFDMERNRSIPSTHRRDASSQVISSYRNERSIDYGRRNPNHEIYMHDHHRSSPSHLSNVSSLRSDLYSDTYRTSDYNTRSERYDIPLNHNQTLSHDYPMPSSSHTSHEQYPSDMNYCRIHHSKDDENFSSSSARISSMDHQDSLSRNYHSSYRARPNLKRSNSDYDDYSSTSSKRPTRR